MVEETNDPETPNPVEPEVKDTTNVDKDPVSITSPENDAPAQEPTTIPATHNDQLADNEYYTKILEAMYKELQGMTKDDDKPVEPEVTTKQLREEDVVNLARKEAANFFKSFLVDMQTGKYSMPTQTQDVINVPSEVDKPVTQVVQSNPIEGKITNMDEYAKEIQDKLEKVFSERLEEIDKKLLEQEDEIKIIKEQPAQVISRNIDKDRNTEVKGYGSPFAHRRDGTIELKI